MLKSFVSLYTDNAVDLAEAPTDARVFVSEVGHQCWYYWDGAAWVRSVAGGLRSNGSVLSMESVNDGQYLKRSGNTIVGDMPAAGGITLADVYPIGSIYTSVIETHPATLFGFGTWEALASGRTLVGVDAGQTEFDAAGKTGGSKTHILTESEMPVHTHVQSAHGHGVTDAGHSHLTQRYPTATGGSSGFTIDTSMSGTLADNTLPVKSSTTGVSVNNATATNQNAGGGQGHNNLMPFTCVYFWRRIS